MVPEIAARAGVGKGTVYRCFPTKDHLVAAVAIRARALVRARGARGRAPATTRGARSLAFMERIADAHCEDRGMVASMSQAIELPELVAARADAHDALRELMDRAIAQGSMRADAEPADLKVLLSGIARSLAADRGARPRRLAALRRGSWCGRPARGLLKSAR